MGVAVGAARADLLITGRIAKVAGTAGFGWAEALAIGEGRVVAVGLAREVETLADRETRRWHLGRDRVVLPGITDAHLHLVDAALAATRLDLSGARGSDETLALVAQAHERRSALGDEQSWLLGHGWSLDRLGEWPTAEALEVVAPGRPIVLWSHDHHSRWASRAALHAGGLDASSRDPPGGVIRRGTDGEPTGVLHETATTLLDFVIPSPTRGEVEAAVVAYASDLARLGVTGCHDPGQLSQGVVGEAEQSVLARMAAEGRLPLRVVESIRERQLDGATRSGFRSGEGVSSSESADPHAARRARRYRRGWLKLFADGSIGSRSAALLEPYEADAGGRAATGGASGMLLQSPEELLELCGRAVGAGIACQIHAIGDRAVRVALDVLAGSSHAGLPLMPRVEHAQVVDPGDVARFAALGVAASVQPVHLGTDHDAMAEALGERAAHAFPLAGLAASRAVVAFGTDAPVEPADPWPGIAIAVTRRDPGWSADAAAHAPDQALDLARALRAATVDPALTVGDARGGRLVTGSAADLLVLDADVLTEPVLPGGRLANARPLAVLIDGERVYDAAALGEE